MTDLDCDFYLRGKGGYVLVSVGLFVCLFVSNITQKVMNGLQWNSMDGPELVWERTD